MEHSILIGGIGLGIVGLAIIAVNLVPFVVEMKAITPVASGKLTTQVIAVKNIMTNLYLIIDGKNTVAIDAGVNLPNAKAELIKNGIRPESVQKVFLTHSDGDHLAALILFNKAHIYLSKDEEQMINGKTVRSLGMFKNKLPVSGYRLLEDDSVVQQGGIRIQALTTPGHTPGSMSYLINNRYLFTGDLLSVKQGKVEVFAPHAFNMDENASRKSIAKIARLDKIELLCTGHHGIISNFDQAMAAWR